MRSRYFNAILVLFFVTWLLPLGTFFKVSQERKLCGGQRAVCLCTLPQLPSSAQGAQVILTAHSSSQEQSSGSGTIRDFLLASWQDLSKASSRHFKQQERSLPQSLFIKSLEPVPKV